MAATPVRHRLVTPDGEPVGGRRVTARLIAPAGWLADHSGEVIDAATAVSGADGWCTLKLTPQSAIAAGGTHYEVRVDPSPTPRYCVVPDAGPVQLAAILVDPATLAPVAAGTGGTVTGSLTLRSSFAGGEDEGQPGQFDSTTRLNLESYQRADFWSYGEVLRIYSRRADSKQMIAWYGPRQFDLATKAPIGPDKPWFWMGAHYEANDHGSIHGHWSCEIPDTTGALQTRLEIPIWNPVTGEYGMDKGVIKTNAADFNVRTSNGQQFRLSAPAGNEKPIVFSNDSNGGDSFRRWKIAVTSEAESTGNVGSNFQVIRYSDDGVVIDAPIVVSRSTGNVTLATGIVATKGAASSLQVNTTSRAGGVGVIAIGNANTVPTGTPTGGGVLFAEGGALKWRNSAGVTTTIAA